MTPDGPQSPAEPAGDGTSTDEEIRRFIASAKVAHNDATAAVRHTGSTKVGRWPRILAVATMLRRRRRNP